MPELVKGLLDWARAEGISFWTVAATLFALAMLWMLGKISVRASEVYKNLTADLENTIESLRRQRDDERQRRLLMEEENTRLRDRNDMLRIEIESLNSEIERIKEVSDRMSDLTSGDES